MAGPKRQPALPADADEHVREMWDRMTRSYLLSVLSNDIIEEHRRSPTGHHSEPLARLLAWCQRRPLPEQYAVKAEADGSFRIVSMTGRPKLPPATPSFSPSSPAYCSVALTQTPGCTSTHRRS